MCWRWNNEYFLLILSFKDNEPNRAMRHSRKYLVRIEDESHLRELANWRLSWPRLLCCALLVLAVVLVCSGMLIAFTPLRTLLPGYMKESQRSATEEGLMRLDSLMTAYEVNQQYIRNYLSVTNTDRETGDSARVSKEYTQHVSDTLSTPSAQEQRFVSQMEERERYNISVLAPLAASDVMFSPVSDNGVLLSATQGSRDAVVVFPCGENVKCAADGSVIAINHAASPGGYEMMVQHNRGFVTVYKGTGTPLVGRGERVGAGQIIALSPSPDSKGMRRLTLQLWHNGHQLVPSEYISRPVSEKPRGDETYESPRGKL